MLNQNESTTGKMIRKSPEFKLKDKKGRNFIVIHLQKFGFLPEVIAIEKVQGQTNKFRVIAFLTKEEEDRVMKEKQEKEKTITNSNIETHGSDKPSTE